MQLGHRRCRLDASPEKRAICNDTAMPTLGRIELRRVTTAAYARAETESPHGYGVYVLHGAFTLCNIPR
jgi:hypothetical protein